MQATARARPVPYSLFAVPRETAGSDPRFVDSPQGTQKGYATRLYADDFCTEIKWNQRESWGNPKLESHVSNLPSEVRRFLKGAVGNVNLSVGNPRTGIRIGGAGLM